VNELTQSSRATQLSEPVSRPPMSRLRRLATAAFVALAMASTVLVSGTAPATSSTPAAAPASASSRDATRPGHGGKPTVVLVHGAWADSSSWAGVVTRLQSDGYTVLAAPNPLRLLSGDAAFLRDFLATIPGPVVLVGHSYGGAVITNAATGNANVKALVYVDAFAPDEGETVNSLVGATSALAGDPAALFDIRPYPGAPEGDADVYLKPTVFTHSFAQDLTHREALMLAATQRPLTLAAGNEPSGEPAWRTTPSWYLLGTQDKIITPTAQKAMAHRAGSHITKVRASHVSLISHPGAVTKLVEAAAEATRGH
jgi:pimeloyl-ACP methyl ester carboxylesterase